MRLTISEARSQLGRLCTIAQDPNQPVVLTRHGRPLAVLVSVAQAERIWNIDNTENWGWYHALHRSRHSNKPEWQDVVLGRDGRVTTPREAAQQVREVQMSRAEERRVLRLGGLKPVEGGEIGEKLPWWWPWGRRR